MQPTAHLLALATAVPQHLLPQQAVSDAAAQLFEGANSPYPALRPIYRNAGIDCRRGVLPLQDLARPRGWRSWHELFRPAALALLEEAGSRALDGAGLQAREVDVLVVACSTGVSVPSLDALLMDRMSFRRDVERVPLVGLGCAGGVLGLSRAGAMARSRPGAVVLFLTVEICTLTFRPGDRSRTNMVATALFGDGAAAAVLRADADAASGPALAGWGEHCWPESDWVMGWRVEDDGLAVTLAPGLPDLLQRDAKRLLDGFLDSQGLTQKEIEHWAVHPGGAKVLAALSQSLALPEEQLAPARAILRRYGNMSAPTVLFVLDKVLASGAAGRVLSIAFGPGFTAAFLLIEARGTWPLNS